MIRLLSIFIKENIYFLSVVYFVNVNIRPSQKFDCHFNYHNTTNLKMVIVHVFFYRASYFLFFGFIINAF